MRPFSVSFTNSVKISNSSLSSFIVTSFVKLLHTGDDTFCTHQFAYKGPSKIYQVLTYTLPETNIALQIGPPKRKFIFQPSIFRGENVSFREGKSYIKLPFLHVSPRVLPNMLFQGIWRLPFLRAWGIIGSMGLVPVNFGD